MSGYDIPVYQYSGPKPGAHLLMLGGIHGNEPCGTAGLARLNLELESGVRGLEAGTLTIAPICNPLAYGENRRWVNANLNRIIKPHPRPTIPEEHYANRIAKLIDAADVVLDLHSYRAGPRPFLILDHRTPQGEAFASAQGIRDWVTGWPQLFAKTPSLSEADTMNYTYQKNKYGLTIECGQNDDPEAPIVAYRCARRSLAHLGLLDNPHDRAPLPRPNVYEMKSVILYEGRGELAVPPINMGRFEKGQTLVRYEDGSTYDAPFAGVMVMPSKTADLGAEWTFLAQKSHPPRLAPGITRSSARPPAAETTPG